MRVIEPLDLLICEKISENLTRKWTINEIARAISKHYAPTHKAIQRLLKEKVLTKNSNNLIEPLFKNTFFLETAEKHRISNVKNDEIHITAKRLEERMDHSFFTAVLFGSSLKGKGRDIDILMIIPNSENIAEFKAKTIRALGSIASKIDLNCVNEESCYEMLNKPNQLNAMNEIMKNHLAVAGVESFYRIIRRWKHDWNEREGDNRKKV